MEAKILEAEAGAAEADRRIHEPAVISDHTRMAAACRRAAEAHAAVAALYERWAHLEAKTR